MKSPLETMAEMRQADRAQHEYDLSMLEAAEESLREHMARIKELEAALAQPAQEPVAWNKPELKTLKHSDNCRYWDEDIYCTCGAIEYAELQFWKNKALAQPAQEPDALTIAYQSGFYDGKKAAQRPWLEMTDEDYARISALCLTPKQAATCAAHILKEKNS